MHYSLQPNESGLVACSLGPSGLQVFVGSAHASFVSFVNSATLCEFES